MPRNPASKANLLSKQQCPHADMQTVLGAGLACPASPPGSWPLGPASTSKRPGTETRGDWVAGVITTEIIKAITTMIASIQPCRTSHCRPPQSKRELHKGSRGSCGTIGAAEVGSKDDGLGALLQHLFARLRGGQRLAWLVGTFAGNSTILYYTLPYHNTTEHISIYIYIYIHTYTHA